jgi:hypothetical protein
MKPYFHLYNNQIIAQLMINQLFFFYHLHDQQEQLKDLNCMKIIDLTANTMDPLEIHVPLNEQQFNRIYEHDEIMYYHRTNDQKIYWMLEMLIDIITIDRLFSNV